MHREAGRPWPILHEDDVIDYMVMEAVAIKARKEEDEARKEAEEKAKRDDFKRDFSELEEHRN